ncbi:MAG: RluA family pseudouridine synthase [Bacteroidota bacterium]
MEPQIISQHHVPHGVSRTPLETYAQELFPDIPSRKGVIKAIKRGEIRINEQVVNKGTWVEAGQLIQRYTSQQPLPKAFPFELKVLYEDPFLAAIHKPAGLPVNGNTYQTIENALLNNLAPSQNIDALPWPRPVHRLDRNTTGILLIAKTASASVGFGRMFEARSIQKTYEALAVGKVPTTGVWDRPIEEKEALTSFQLLEQVPSLHGEWLSWVRLYPKTGRTHQLRIHLSQAGFPILGDKLYGKPGLIFRGKGMFLCATQVQMKHPITREEMNISTSPPNKFRLHMDRTRTRWEKFQ